MKIISYWVDNANPDLKKYLYLSNMGMTLDRFVLMSILLSLLGSTIFSLPIAAIIYMFVESGSVALLSSIGAFFFLLFAIFTVLLQLPYFNFVKMGKQMEGEVAITGRRLLIMIESGKSLINSLIELGSKKTKANSKNTPLQKIALELYMGQPLEDVIKKAIKNSPSRSFKEIFIQIHNSLRTGSDLKTSLKVTLEEITRQKRVEFETFGKKLNPIGMLYMIVGTIGPSIGVVGFVIMLAVLRIEISFKILSVFLILVFLIQLMFIGIFSSMRPKMDI